MTQLKPPKKPVPEWERVRDEWVRAVEQLVTDVESWCRANDWPTRRIDKRLEESRIGEYYAPGLLIQVDFLKLMLEPGARFVTGADGLVDLYLMPQYDEAVRLLWRRGQWEYVASVSAEKLPSDQRPNDPLSDVVGVVGTLTAATFTDLIRYLI